MIGVSPAFFISRFGDHFTVKEVADGLTEITEIGFTAFQPEIFHAENLNNWLNGGAKLVAKQAKALGLKTTQFVAHFMMKAFSDAERLNSGLGLGEMKTVLRIVDHFENCRVITVPLGAFSLLEPIDVAAYQTIFAHCCEKVCRLLELVEKSGRRLALEVIPGAIIGGTDGFLRLCERIETDSLGFNFDTGQAWAAKENLYLIPAKLGKGILGTHLCDNWGHDNLSLRPGKGSIDWGRIISALQATGYEGPYDIEIVCEPDKVKEEYRHGRDHIINVMADQEPAAI